MDELPFYILFTVYQSYQDDGKLIMKGCVQYNSGVVGWCDGAG